MTPSRSPILPLTGLLLLFAAACGDDGTSPADLGSLDPMALATALDELQAPLQASNPAITNLRQSISGLTEAGIEFDHPATTRFTAAFRSVALAPPAPPLAVVIPPEALGATFVLDVATMEWVQHESREGAPADGVRIIWYAVDGSGEIALPLTEQGYIDVTPGQNTAADPIMVRIVDTEGSPLTLMDYGQWHDTTSVGTAATEAFGATGFFADATTTVDFSMSSSETADTVSGDEMYELAVTLEDPEVAYELEVSGDVEGASDGYDDLLTATAVHNSATTIMELAFRGTADLQESASGTLAHDGTVVANIDIAGNSFQFSKPGGGTVPADQASELNLLFQEMTLNGFNLIYRIPLFFVL